MSDDPRKKSRANGNKKGSSIASANSNALSIQTSEPRSNLTALSTLGRSSDADKKIKTGSKAVLPGAVAQTTSTSNGQSMATQNTLTEFVSGKEGTKGSNYRRRTVTRPRFISEPRTATGKKVSLLLTYKKFKNQSDISASTDSLRHSEAKTLPASVKSSKVYNKMESGTRAVASIAATDKDFKQNKYDAKPKVIRSERRAVALSSDISSRLPSNIKDSKASSYGLRQIISETAPYDDSKPITQVTMTLTNTEPSTLYSSVKSSKSYKKMKTGTEAVLPGAVAQSESNAKSLPTHNTLTDFANGIEGTKGRNYRRRTVTTPRFISEPRVATKNRVSSSFAYTSTENEINASETTESNPLKSPFSEFISDSHCSDTSAEAHDETSSLEFGHIAVADVSHDSARYICHDNSQGLVVATLVENDRNIVGTDIIVDAIVVVDKPAKWYKDRQTLMIIGITVIVSVLISVVVYSQLSGDVDGDDGDDVVFVFASSPRGVLKSLYDSTSGPSWTITWDFNSGQSHCDFYGITCDDTEQITEISLDDNGLRGSLPSEIGMLSSLTSLSLYLNAITGTIPSEIGTIPSLAYLALHANSITGIIPSEIGMFSSLQRLELYSNLINGTIPSEIGMLLSLQRLDFDSNSITGTIPSEIGMFSSLQRLELYSNAINGTIPSEIGMLSSLQRLDLDNNSITGSIPSEIGMLSSLAELELDRNSIKGMIPSEIGMLLSLQRFELDYNSIMGTLPTEHCELTNTFIWYDEEEISCSCIDSSYREGTTCN